jgi:Ion channel
MAGMHNTKESAFGKHRFFFLFVFLLATLILYPFAEGSRLGLFIFRAIGSIAIIASIYAAKSHRFLLVFIILLAIPAIFHRMLLSKSDVSLLFILSNILSLLFDVLIVVILFRRIFQVGRPNSETIFGALCLYLLMGFSFSSVYGMVAALQPKAFFMDPQFNVHTTLSRFDCIYYSFGTITSLGAAGIVPVTAQARSVSILEAVLGILYLAVLIARLMGAYRPKAES